MKFSSFIVLFLSAIATSGVRADAVQDSPKAVSRLQGISEVHVKIKSSSDKNSLEQSLLPNQRLIPLFNFKKSVLENLRNAAPGLPDLTLWFKIIDESSKEQGDITVLSNNILANDFVEETYIEETQPPPQMTPDFTGRQTYLRPIMENGINAEFSWTVPGGTGKGITIYDVEYNWNQNHEDLKTKIGNIKMLVPEDDSQGFPDFNDNVANQENIDGDHGTAVLGEMISDPTNNLGVRGISPDANIGLAPEYLTKGFSKRAEAIIRACEDGKPGDIILLEMQTRVCGFLATQNNPSFGFGPAEERGDVYDAIVTAVGNGFVVVAAAGNGSANLDDPACGGRYDGTVRADSGAIMVGAGSSGKANPQNQQARERLDFSSFGSRVNLQGWGNDVYTTGYGGFLDSPPDINRQYTPSFSGTSSASPIVAAAAANLQGIAIARFGVPLTPREIRRLLVDTGIPQTGTNIANFNIGPLPNLLQAINALQNMNFPTSIPTRNPSVVPTSIPTRNPSSFPSFSPSSLPSLNPSSLPSLNPSSLPSLNPSSVPSLRTTLLPSSAPVKVLTKAKKSNKFKKGKKKTKKDKAKKITN